MSVDFAALLDQRNARFRAWRLFGVPVRGGWTLSREEGEAELRLYCLACRAQLGGRHFADLLQALAPASLLHAEREELLVACRHLAPLAGDDPPEVVALTALELLAGDPPR
jgi:hypothetical protein